MITKKRYEFKNKAEMKGWQNLSGNSHLENPEDIFAKPVKWGLFKWNPQGFYPTEEAISLHNEEVWHDDFVCIPVEYLS